MPATDTVSDRARQIVDEFSLFDDWMSRYEYLIELGDDIPLLDEDEKTEDNYIHGCQSDVWIQSELDDQDPVLHFRGDSNAKITKGLAALIIRVLDEQPPDAVANADFDFLDDIGLHDHLSSQRNNGLKAMIETVQERARRFRN
ncbi:MAG: Fe-S metabolism protein SufE [Bacteroidetes bacterium QS_3_64_15]|nr:MAG: Fe-S metabolism protein SufE [Bacteroidetes bacterium QS_3_64_15]